MNAMNNKLRVVAVTCTCVGAVIGGGGGAVGVVIIGGGAVAADAGRGSLHRLQIFLCP